MICLSSITLREISLPLKEPFRTADGVVDHRRVLLLEIHDKSGRSTWSECVAEATAGYSDETVDTCWRVISEQIAPGVIGRDFESPGEADAFLALEFPRARMARAAIEMGVWALGSLETNLSLAALLNSHARHPIVPRSHVAAGIAVGMQNDASALAERCRSAANEGYRRIKIKISPGRDVEYVGAVRNAVGIGISLSVDGNRSYSIERDDDLTALEALDDFDLSMIEQPLGDLESHSALQRRISTPVCLDESITSTSDVERMLQLDSARIVNLKPGRVGGFTESIAIHDLCQNSGVPVWCGGMNETGIGRAYNVALASLPHFTLPGDLSPSSRYWNEDIISEPWTMDRLGNIEVPLDNIGIGVEVNTALIERLTSREHTITEP
ncbi:MAG TPA: o-succinylbenzoate synthase [Gemmatimonadaceae bacterium]